MSVTHEAWLRRLSDYHSGGVADAERAAVEEHLRTCEDCQEAIAMYRRFYFLLRSPLRLGAPSAHFDRTTIPLTDTPQRREAGVPQAGGSGGPARNRRWLAGVAAVLAAAVVIGGFVAIIGPRLRAPVAANTPTPRASATVQVTATPATPPATATTGPGAFVCANPAGSSMIYVYMRGDSDLYIVNGCGAPRQITHTPASPSLPLAWSPSNRYLAITGAANGNSSYVEIVDAQTGAARQTSFMVDFGNAANAGDQDQVFLGWIDDSHFLGAIATIAQNPQGFEEPGPTTLVKVNATTGARTALGEIKDWANINSTGPISGSRVVAHGRYFFYAASDSSGSTGYLHRFDLTTGVDTRLVSLGQFTQGGCQVTPVCAWTAWWDVSPDGAHILYHHPGANQGPSDTGSPNDTPLFYANPDGSQATQLFGSQLADGLLAPLFAPNGQLAVVSGSWTGAPNPFGVGDKIKIATIGGAVKTINGAFSAWRGDSAALLFTTPGTGTAPPSLYELQSGATSPLEAGASDYLWGN